MTSAIERGTLRSAAIFHPTSSRSTGTGAWSVTKLPDGPAACAVDILSDGLVVCAVDMSSSPDRAWSVTNLCENEYRRLGALQR